MATKRSATWTPVKRWTAQTRQAFEAHLAALRGGRSGSAELDDFIADERTQPVVLKQAQVLVETQEPTALRAALELLAPLVAPDTRGTNFREALVTQADALAGLGDLEGAVERCLRVVTRLPDRGDAYLVAGASLARHAQALPRERQREAIAALDLRAGMGTEVGWRDFLYLAELARLFELAADPRAADRRRAATSTLEALSKRERAAAARRRPQLVAAYGAPPP